MSEQQIPPGPDYSGMGGICFIMERFHLSSAQSPLRHTSVAQDAIPRDSSGHNFIIADYVDAAHGHVSAVGKCDGDGAFVGRRVDDQHAAAFLGNGAGEGFAVRPFSKGSQVVGVGSGLFNLKTKGGRFTAFAVRCSCIQDHDRPVCR